MGRHLSDAVALDAGGREDPDEEDAAGESLVALHALCHHARHRDIADHRLRVTCSDGTEKSFALEPMSVAAFYRKTMDAVAAIGVEVKINTKPNEVENPIHFEEDEQHKSYDAAAAHRFWLALVQA